MPAADCQEPATAEAVPASSSFGLPIFGRRRDQVHSMESTHETGEQEDEFQALQRQVAERLHDLAASDEENLLSIAWIQKLLDAFLSCQEEFRIIVFNNKGCFTKPPVDRYMSDFFDRSVKALDVCNAIRDGIEQMRQWQKHMEIVLCALDVRRTAGEGQFRRARKALNDLAAGMSQDKEVNSNLAHRNRSFGRMNAPPPPREHRSPTQSRSLSWSVSRSWSASRQLQAIGGNLVLPKSVETSANRLNLAVFSMNHVLLFVMWALVAAIPCQDRGLQSQPSVSRQFIWAAPVLSLQERILEESRKRDRKNACGLLKEIHEIEKCSRNVTELIDAGNFPEKEAELKGRVGELALVYGAVSDGLDPLERRVREVFHRIVRCRTEGLDSSWRTSSHSR